MSRRQRRKESSQNSPRWVRRLLIPLLTAFIVALGTTSILIQQYLHSDGFRSLLAVKVNEALQVDGHLSPLEWDGLALRINNYEAIGSHRVTSLQIDNIQTEISLGQLLQGVWKLGPTQISKVRLNADLSASEKAKPNDSFDKAPEQNEGGFSLPSKVSPSSIRIAELSLFADTVKGPISASRMAAAIEPSSGTDMYRLHLSHGEVTTPWEKFPQFHLNKLEATLQESTVFLTSADATAYSAARLSINGEWNYLDDLLSLEGNLKNLRCDELLSENWARRFSGDLASTFLILKDPGGPARFSGSASLTSASLTALPLLDALAAYADTRRFRTIALNAAETQWRVESGKLELQNLVLASEGLLRIEGNLTVVEERLSGILRLGLVPGILRNIPGAEEDIFAPGADGLLWTPVIISGTIDDPREDLTGRLINAAGNRMLATFPETGEKVFKYTQEKLIEKSPQVIKETESVIRKADEILDEANGILQDLLGR